MVFYKKHYTRNERMEQVFTIEAGNKIFPLIDKYIVENIKIQEILDVIDESNKEAILNNIGYLFDVGYSKAKEQAPFVTLSYYDIEDEEHIIYIPLEEPLYSGLKPDCYDYNDGHYLFGTKEERIKEAQEEIEKINERIQHMENNN